VDAPHLQPRLKMPACIRGDRFVWRKLVLSVGDLGTGRSRGSTRRVAGGDEASTRVATIFQRLADSLRGAAGELANPSMITPSPPQAGG
jgi:hypothetical protein